jgi:outer membrane protein TolC
VVTGSLFADFKNILTKYFETCPEAVTTELVWQNANDEYNGALLKASSKLDILQADVVRYQYQLEYYQKKWKLTAELIDYLMEWKKAQIEKNIAEIKYNMYSEDYANKQKALAYGGVSQNDVQSALILRDLHLSELDYYKNARTQLEAYLKEILSLDEIPAIVLHMELLPVISEETEKTAKENSIEIKIAKSSNEIESTKYKLSSTGITTSFQADYSKRMAKIHELNVKSLEQSLNFELLRYYEGLKIAMARLKASAEEKNLQLGLLPKVQESHTKGYITAIDYYEKLLEIYEYDRTTHEAELEYIQSLISFLRQSYSDPIVELPKYIETK